MNKIIGESEWPHIGEWQDGYKLRYSSGDAIEADSNYILSPYYAIEPGHKIAFYGGDTSTLTMLDEMPLNFTSISQRLDYWNTWRNKERPVTTKSNTHYIIICMIKRYLDVSYVIDLTTGEYIYKGANAVRLE